jgi:hypothetical protein
MIIIQPRKPQHRLRRLSLLLMPFLLRGDLLVPPLVRLKGSSSSTEVAEVLSLGFFNMEDPWGTMGVPGFGGCFFSCGKLVAGICFLIRQVPKFGV